MTINYLQCKSSDPVEQKMKTLKGSFIDFFINDMLDDRTKYQSVSFTQATEAVSQLPKEDVDKVVVTFRGDNTTIQRYFLIDAPEMPVAEFIVQGDQSVVYLRLDAPQVAEPEFDIQPLLTFIIENGMPDSFTDKQLRTLKRNEQACEVITYLCDGDETDFRVMAEKARVKCLNTILN